eukprot:Rmarinus@m.5792
MGYLKFSQIRVAEQIKNHLKMSQMGIVYIYLFKKKEIMRGKLVLVGLLSVALFACDNGQSVEEIEQESMEMREQFNEDKEELREEFEEVRMKLSEKIDELDKRMELANEEAKLRLKEAKKNLEDERSNLDDSLKELENSTEEGWNQMKVKFREGVEAAKIRWEEFTLDLEEAFSKDEKKEK